MYKYLIAVLLSFFLIVSTGFCCDFDNDSIDDPTTYNSSTQAWKAKLSGDDSTLTINSFGAQSALPVPGYYLGNSSPAFFAYIDPNFFWKIYLAEDNIDGSLNFGRVDASYLGGHDYNGDGVTDAVKVINRCRKLKKSCHKNKARFNILYNIPNADDAFSDISPLVSSFFGKGASPLFVMDVNLDQKDDICFAKPLRKNKKNFRAICQDVASQAILDKFKLGKIYNLPLSANILGRDQVVTWKTRKSSADTLITIINPTGGKSNHIVPSDGEVLIGDWLGIGSEQIGVATGGVLTVLNPITATISSILIPDGNPIDCNNNIYGNAARVFLNSRNVCRILNCK